MISLREKTIILISFIIICYLLWRTNNLYYDSICDHIFLNVLLFFIWYICFNSRHYVMTCNRLNDYYLECPLEYTSLTSNGMVRDIYVRIGDEGEWYKLDYSLTLELDCGYNVYEEFVSKNKTVGELLSTMKSHISSASKLVNINYILFKCISLMFFIIFEFFYWVIYTKFAIY